ncbi:MAG TPA: hypothetical protein VMY88_07365 [Acidimicrobiales bacterium]|nr:hypothetical protein [Acidimicrobiales bacterium]
MSFAVADVSRGSTDADFEVLEDVTEWLGIVVRGLEPGALDGPGAATGVAVFAAIENMAAAGKALCATRVARTRHWRIAGDRTPAHWVARTTGCSIAEAMAATQVPERLGALPETDAQFRAGGLTLAQTRHITEAASADPRSESHLLELAHREPLPVLRDHCQRVIAAACEDDEARYRKVHDGRYLRSWTNAEGAFRMDISGTPDAGAEVMAALEPIAKRLGRQARRNGCTARKEALLFDALVELCRGKDADGNVQRPRFSINITADRDAWLRGRTRSGEKCEIDGAGPIPVPVAHALVDDGVLNEVGMEGPDVVSLVSRSRYIPANVRRAVIARDPVCIWPGCYQRKDLQFHHWRDDFSRSRRTSLDDLCRACTFHHDLVTKGFAKLIGGPGKWDVIIDARQNRMRTGADPPALPID